MTELASVIQALAFKHATLVAETIKVLRPQLQKMPVLSALADFDSLARADRLSEAIVTGW
ncbi:MAG TPA: hypothetical protein VFY42_01405 [Gemmatimonadales bacterium]|nr:hypothetical protein [Gemmatimonadales bacterium]